MTDWDDPDVEERWCAESRERVIEYLAHEKMTPGAVGEWPAWHVAPIVSMWAIESARRPGWVGWWVIEGDLPTDYISASGVRDPRAAVAAFAERWKAYVVACRAGQPPADYTVGDGSSELLDLLESRAKTLAELANDEANWTALDDER